MFSYIEIASAFFVGFLPAGKAGAMTSLRGVALSTELVEVSKGGTTKQSFLK